MKNSMSCKIRWQRVVLAVMMGASLCALLALAACGGGTTQSASSAASSSATASSAASSSAATSSAATSTAAVSQSSAAQAPPEVYVRKNVVVNMNDGSTRTYTYGFDDNGRPQMQSIEEVSSDLTIKDEIDNTEWDEFGHQLKAVETCDPGEGGSFMVDVKASDIDVNEDGSMHTVTYVSTVNKDSFEKDEMASQKATQTIEYGANALVSQKEELKVEQFDQSGKLLLTQKTTKEYDEDGLQTYIAIEEVDADGNGFAMTGDITWTKDANGKPVSYQFVMSAAGETLTSSGDVTVDDLGLISRVDNIVVDGQKRSTNVTIDYEKIDNPLPGAYESSKTFSLSDYTITVA